MDRSFTPPPEPISRFRGTIVRGSAWLGLVFLVAIVLEAVRTGTWTDPRVWASLVIASVLFIVVSAEDWAALMARPAGEWLAWGVVLVFAGVLGIMSSIRPLSDSTLPQYFGVVVFSGAVLGLLKHLTTTLVAMTFFAMTAVSTGQLSDVESVVAPLLSMGFVAAATALLRISFESQTSETIRALDDLRRQETNFERLYAVSSTLADAQSLAEAVPNLVGTICRYLDAQVGMVLLHQSSAAALRVLSPIWVSGAALALDPIDLPLARAGIIQQAFNSGASRRVGNVSAIPDAHGILGELGLAEALVAPLRVETTKVGVIVVGDPTRRSFSDEDLEVLGLLAAPAALVVSQLGRYEAAAEMSRRMEEMAAMKSDFVSVVSHELRTPLTSIIGSLDTASRPELAPESSAARDLLASARRQATRLQRLIEDLLTVSRIDRGSLPLHPEELRLRAFLSDLISAFPWAGDRLALRVEPPDLSVSADPDHLGRILINLVENAGKYAPEGPVEVTARAAGSSFELVVADHGPGISPDQRESAFERFARLERSAIRSHGGTGLGLSIVRALSEAMGGEVTLAETPGGGCTFSVNLPAAPGVRKARAG